MGAATLGCFGYIGPFAVQSLLYRIKLGPMPVTSYFEGIAAWHWPPNLTGYTLLVPNVLCMLLLGLAGFCGFPDRLWCEPARRLLCAGLLALLSVLAFGLVMMFIHPTPRGWSAQLNAVVYMAASAAGPVTMLVWFLLSRVKRRKSDKPNDACESPS